MEKGKPGKDLGQDACSVPRRRPDFGTKRALSRGKVSRNSTHPRWLSRLERVSSMSGPEIRTRTMQALSKRWDAAIYRLPGRKETALGVAGEPAVGRFFFSASEVPRLLQLIQDRLPDCVRTILSQAEAICRHQFDLLGYSRLDYGAEIDWSLDAVHGKRAPRRAWYKIPFLDFAAVGDAKVTWELNRHQHLVTLAKAYRFTGEGRFLGELVAQWYHWQRTNPYPLGINWASTLEVAFRSLSWLWVMHLVGDCQEVPTPFRPDLERALFFNARYIERYLSTYFSPNTHLLGEGVALFFLGLLLPANRRTERWQRRGWEIVLTAAERQVLADGMHFERSTYYHVYALDFFLHARMLAAANGIAIPSDLDIAMRKMLDALYLLMLSGGGCCWGDDDGGRLFDRARNQREHLLDPLATGAVLFGAAHYKSLVREPPEETLWLLGAGGLTSFDRLAAQSEPAGSGRLPVSGLYCLAGQSPVLEQLTVEASSESANGGGHAHADALSLQLTLDGERFLVDPGTCAYVSDGPERSRFRGTAAHNTLRVDNCEQGVEGGPFPWRSLPAVEVTRWVSGEWFDLFSARHTGYERLADPVVHHRTVLSRKGRLCFVVDVATGHETHELELAWHLDPQLHVARQEHGLLVKGRSASLALVPLAKAGWSRTLEEDWYSPVYGRRERSAVVRLRARTRLPADFATVLEFMPGNGARLGSLTQFDDNRLEPAVRAYHYRVEDRSYVFFWAQSDAGWELGEFASDALFLYYETSSGGEKLLFLSHGSYVKLGGFPLLSCAETVERCEVRDGPAGVEVHATGKVACAERLPDLDHAGSISSASPNVS